MDLTDLLQMAGDANASDLILVVGMPPVLRVDGKLTLTELPILTPKEAERLIFSVLNEQQLAEFKEHQDVDFSFEISGIARFRVNVHQQRGSVAAAMRRIPFKIPTLTELNLPKTIITEICRLRSGLVLVTGQSGSGKSTTLASMIDIINDEKACHVITIEDPIEYVHRHKKAVVEQREVYKDAASFASALRNILRQDADIILVGEMRDLETISTVLTAAETGQLVLTTLHTLDASETINRIIDFYPAHQHDQVKVQLASCLKGVISQRLVPKSHEKGLVVACEIMVATSAIKTLIREGSVHQLPNVIETGSKFGMQSMDQALLNLYERRLIDKPELLYNMKDRQRMGDKMSLG